MDPPWPNKSGKKALIVRTDVILMHGHSSKIITLRNARHLRPLFNTNAVHDIQQRHNSSNLGHKQTKIQKFHHQQTLSIVETRVRQRVGVAQDDNPRRMHISNRFRTQETI